MITPTRNKDNRTRKTIANIKADALQEFADSLLEPHEYTLSYGTLSQLLEEYIERLKESK